MGVVHEFSEAPHITHADTAYESHDFGTMAEGKLGITVDMNKAVKFYADTGYVSDFSEYGSIKGNIGLRMAW